MALRLQKKKAGGFGEEHPSRISPCGAYDPLQNLQVSNFLKWRCDASGRVNQAELPQKFSEAEPLRRGLRPDLLTSLGVVVRSFLRWPSSPTRKRRTLATATGDPVSLRHSRVSRLFVGPTSP